MFLNDESTWPLEVRSFLERHLDLFSRWGSAGASLSFAEARRNARQYDNAIYQLQDILRGHILEGGFHCTRLTEPEIDQIATHGLKPQNQETLRDRLRAILNAGLIEPEIAERLSTENYADQPDRADRTCLCFFDLGLDDQGGIERFFRFWGGEALYGPHEDHPTIGPILRGIGQPCVIEVQVPITNLILGCEFHLVDQFLINRNLRAGSADHEDQAGRPIPRGDIIRIVRFSDSEFSALTGCDCWNPPLTG
jgi:hypothetical protein